MKMSFLAALAVACCATGPAHAEKADRDKAVNLEADRVNLDDKNKVTVFDGNVQLTQGSLIIRTERLVVHQDADGMQKAFAYGGAGGLARFRQKREAKDDFVEGEAERIEQDDRADKTEFFGRAHVHSGLDDLRGNYISYDAKSESYYVTGGAPGAAASRDARVHAIIQPKNKAPSPASRGGEGTSAKAAPELADPAPSNK
jgi:lipopolysaccharide export system protein LptA